VTQFNQAKAILVEVQVIVNVNIHINEWVSWLQTTTKMSFKK